MLGVGGGARAEEVEGEAAPALQRIEVAVGVEAADLLALEELGDLLHLLPGRRHFPRALVAFGRPGRREVLVLEVVGAIVEVVAVAVDRDAVGLAVPGADRRLEVADVVVHVDLAHDPLGHDRGEALAADVALEGGAHLDDVEIDRAGGDRLLQAGVVVGLGEVDPVDGGPGVGLPRLQEAAEEEVVQVLVVEAEEGELDTGELAFGNVLLGRPEAHRPHLLPIGIHGRAHAHAGNLEDFGAHVVLRRRGGREAADAGSRKRRHRAGAGHALQHPAPGRLGRHDSIEDVYSHPSDLPEEGHPVPAVAPSAPEEPKTMAGN